MAYHHDLTVGVSLSKEVPIPVKLWGSVQGGPMNAYVSGETCLRCCIQSDAASQSSAG